MKHFVLGVAMISAVPVAAAPGQAVHTVDYAADAGALDRIIVENYAYEDHWPGGTLPQSATLIGEKAAVHDEDSLLHYAEDRIASLADHHSITGSSFKDSWAVVPTYADLWVERQESGFVITAIREGSPADKLGIVAGDKLVEVGGVPTGEAVTAFWDRMGLSTTPERQDYAARVLAAGRRDRPRDLTILHNGISRRVALPSLYSIQTERPPVTVSRDNSDHIVIRFNNSLGDQATIAAFDSAMARISAGSSLVIDLTDTPSGGNTSVARAIMGWFVERPRSYQVHQLPSEERETGIPRQWIEQVLPRAGKFHRRLPLIRVSRWTGSMGEGLAIGFAALGAPVEGTRMAQLKGAVYDFSLSSSGLVVKLPAERLYTVAGLARENFVPRPIKK
jgi:carboxyl-terminal processing protease